MTAWELFWGCFALVFGIGLGMLTLIVVIAAALKIWFVIRGFLHDRWGLGNVDQGWLP